MKQIIFVVVALVVYMSSGMVYAQSGHVDLSYQNSDLGSKDADITAFTGTTLISEHMQLDGRYASFDIGSSSVDYLNINGFLFSRVENLAYGGYVGFETLNTGSSSYDGWLIGGFRQHYIVNTTLTGQIGYANSENDAHVIHMDGEVRHFYNESFSIQGNLGYGNIDVSGNSVNQDFWSWGIGAEFQLSGIPLSIYGGWQRLDFGKNESDLLGIGARWDFGSGSLIKRNRSGAGFSRTASTLNELDFGGQFSPR